MDTQLSLSLVEIIVLLMGAITLGITIHFFIVSRRSLKATSPILKEKINRELEQRKLRYLNDIEWKDKELADLKKRLAEEEENTQIYSIEAEEMRSQNKTLQAEIEALRNAPPPTMDKAGHIEQLRQAQQGLREYNDKINNLLSQIDLVQEADEKQKEIEQNNEALSRQLDDLRFTLNQKEKELMAFRKNQELTREMTSMLDSTYNEFNVLQEKILKLESQVNLSKKVHLDYEDIKEENAKLTRDLEDHKFRHNAVVTQNKSLEASLAEAEDKLREANFQRQQLQKRVSYLEDLNSDMQAVADANKKLETQIKRIGELESRLNMVAEERDELARKQMNA
jgi:chromosome segregation ATPase